MSLYTALPALAALYGRVSMDTLHERVGEEELLRGLQKSDDRATFNGEWARIVGWGGHREGSSDGIYGSGGPRFDYSLFALQAGIDLYRRENDEGIRNIAGLYGVIGRAQGKVLNYTGQEAGDDTLNAYSIGGYWTRFGKRGGYLDAIAQFTWYDAKAQSVRLDALEGSATALGLSLEGGLPLHFKEGWVIEPQGQIMYQRFNGDRADDVAAKVSFEETDSLIGRLGARLARTWARTNDDGETRLSNGWVRLNVWQVFSGGEPKTTFSSEYGPVAFTSNVGGTSLELNGGVTRQMTRASTLYFGGGYQWGLDGRGHAYTGQVGVRFNW